MKKCIKCGSHAFNLHSEAIDQGGFCDVHYWEGRAHRAEAQLVRQTARIVDLQTHIENLEGEDT